MVVFDGSDAAPARLRGPVGRLVRSGVLVVAVADGELAGLAPLAGRDIDGGHQRNLYLAPRRGAEIHGFDDALSLRCLGQAVDAPTWAVQALAGPRGIAAEEVLVVGDGFRAADLPAGVHHQRGDAALVRQILAEQAALHPVRLPAEPVLDPAWSLVEDGFVLTREHEIESLFAIGNGLVGTRGALAEGSPLSAPATFVAGLFDAGTGSVPGLARAPDWAHLAGIMDGRTLQLSDGQPLEHRRVLDMRQAILWRHWVHRDPSGRVTRIEGMRLVSLADRHLLIQSIALTPENYSGHLVIEAESLSRAVPIRTTSGIGAELAAASRIEDPEGSWTAPAEPEPGARERWTVEVELGRSYRLDRLAAVHRSRGAPGSGATARELVERAYEEGVGAAVEAHIAAWRQRWDQADVVIDGDPEAQRAIRFAIYHLVSAANPDDPQVSIGARALTGPAYKGHVFWDTEIFMVPFFSASYPEAARALLSYRHHTLPAARERAARRGYQGALYAWESADTGDDVTPSVVVAPTGEIVRILVGEQEQHISADVAYAVWRHWQATGDESFLLEGGAEILLETARFWASRAQLEDDGRCHIRTVIGPDEYHESVDDNAYTNGMAQWNLEIGAETAALLAARWPARWHELSGALELDDQAPRHWLEVARALKLDIDPETGLIEQFEGYFGLEDIDLGAYADRSVPMDVILDRDRLQGSQIIKQPDVLMLIYLLWDRFPAAVREANFDYYDARTGHGSSLSPPIHAALAARLGRTELAARYLRQTAEIDLANNMGNAAGGVHAAALGGLWQAVIFGFAGVSLTPEGPRAEPHLPPTWRELRFQLTWRGQRIAFELRPDAGAARTAEALP